MRTDTNRVHSLAAVVFDCDGVLVDTEPLHYRTFQEVLRPFGLEYDYEEYKERYIGFDDRDAILEAFRRGGLTIEPEKLADLIRAKSMAMEKVVSGGVETFPGLVDLVRELTARRVPMAVASGAIRHDIELFLKALEMADAFPVIVAADDVKKSKPDPETYVKALDKLIRVAGLDGVHTRQCVAIEDTPAGIESARAAGLFVIGVTHSFPKSDLAKADFVAESLTELSLTRMRELVA